ncbi:MAG: fumarylacetoacetate hydrolase family protein [Paludibacteraceae bacterium]|nr:fumarylacetoacetate hydrolase family protein [Paludibacteraceae bacterium]
MKILAVGWNYMAHNKELNPTNVPTEPVIFMKPETALLRENKPFFLPDFSSDVQYETEVVVRISKMGKNISEKFAPRYYDAYALGIDFTARDLQRKFKENGGPWEICKGFDNSAPISEFIPKEELGDLSALPFHLDLNGATVQQGNTKDMIFNVDTIIAYVSRFFTLKTGDLIFTGTPVGVGPVKIGDRLEGYLADRKLLDFRVE